ncbi:hypothetical protein FBD94_16710 [Pedobacter hiemivivus]|uniref:Uncharacterized protein n=1 Tax=Pedobacter hiemivivus TaxID=2530454 RepID=A0A4U1GD98_9SPHI|nr:hypothetical protein [Pedobacter hiemivivus]TKC59172.1 hypothetical protein FBD94_16710 [Pedobacter hiemivivus]
MASITPRARVIEDSVHLEKNISTYLCLLLGIDLKTTKLFKSEAMSFDVKLNLLLELNYFDKLKREKFRRFSEIRNKFAHLADVITFTDCYERLGGIENHFKRWYPSAAIKKSGEDLNKEYYNLLKTDLFEDITDFTEYFDSTKKKELEVKEKAERYSLILKEMNKLAKTGTEQRRIFQYIKRRVQETMRNSFEY